MEIVGSRITPPRGKQGGSVGLDNGNINKCSRAKGNEVLPLLTPFTSESSSQSTGTSSTKRDSRRHQRKRRRESKRKHISVSKEKPTKIKWQSDNSEIDGSSMNRLRSRPMSPSESSTEERESMRREIQQLKEGLEQVRRKGPSSKDPADCSRVATSKFADRILVKRFSGNFKMPNVIEYKEDRDPVKHISRFTTLMGTQTRDDRLLCQAFPITFRDLAGSWFGQLSPRSIDNFEQFGRAFSRQFMGSVQRKKSLSHLSSVKQGKGEPIRTYLSRFNREAVQVEDFNDAAAINILTNGLQSGAFSFHLRKQRPKTYPEMVEIAADNARAEEEEIA
ncbi:hypothetical protein ACOSP7_010628 [Xanthoceras sorbifolium]